MFFSVCIFYPWISAFLHPLYMTKIHTHTLGYNNGVKTCRVMPLNHLMSTRSIWIARSVLYGHVWYIFYLFIICLMRYREPNFFFVFKVYNHHDDDEIFFLCVCVMRTSSPHDYLTFRTFNFQQSQNYITNELEFHANNFSHHC